MTYDITAWSIPFAYGLETVASTNLVQANEIRIMTAIHNNPSPNSAGYISKWNSMQDASFLSELLLNNTIKGGFPYSGFAEKSASDICDTTI